MDILALSSLVALLLAAVVCDLRTRRIPNALVVAGVTLGLALETLHPSGGGLFSQPVGAIGFSSALLGGLVGLGLFLPLYALRAMGAGDVKLLAMVGVWLGATGVAHAALWTLLAGGALAIAAALWSGVLRQVLANIRVMLSNSLVRAQLGIGFGLEPPTHTTGRLPYAVAIACGTAFEVARMMALLP